MSFSNFQSWTEKFLLLGCVCLLGLTGCGEGEFPRHEILGTVTFQGKPVKEGMLTMEPVHVPGPLAPTCYAAIKNGTFKISREEGPTTGVYGLLISAIDVDKLPQNGPPPTGDSVLPELFPSYRLTVDIPPPDGKLTIEVPDSAARPAP